MTRPPRRRVRWVPLACLLVAALCAWPVVAFYARPTIYFSAAFDVSASPGGSSPQAEVGQFVAPTHTAFSVVPAADEGGELKVSDNGTPVEERLQGVLKKQFSGQELRVEFEVRPSQASTALSVRLVDDSNTGMIDCTFGSDGWIRIGGHDVAPYAAGQAYAVTLDLIDPLAGPELWTVVIQGPSGLILDAGPLSLAKQLTVRSVDVVRPAGSTAGEFRVDDLKVLSYGKSFGL